MPLERVALGLIAIIHTPFVKTLRVMQVSA